MFPSQKHYLTFTISAGTLKYIGLKITLRRPDSYQESLIYSLGNEEVLLDTKPENEEEAWRALLGGPVKHSLRKGKLKSPWAVPIRERREKLLSELKE